MKIVFEKNENSAFLVFLGPLLDQILKILKRACGVSIHTKTAMASSNMTKLFEKKSKLSIFGTLVTPFRPNFEIF